MKEVKGIISHFTNIDPSEIVESTKIDYTVVDGSIFLLRMYSKLASIGYNVGNPGLIVTYGDLLGALGKHSDVEK
jgi:hypothetical protein